MSLPIASTGAPGGLKRRVAGLRVFVGDRPPYDHHPAGGVVALMTGGVEALAPPTGRLAPSGRLRKPPRNLDTSFGAINRPSSAN